MDRHPDRDFRDTDLLLSDRHFSNPMTLHILAIVWCVIALGRLRTMTNKQLRDLRLIYATMRDLIEATAESTIKAVALNYLEGQIIKIDRILDLNIGLIGSAPR